MKTLVLGLGNPILCDDGAGIHVVREIRDRVKGSSVDVSETALAGMRLLDLLAGYDKAIIIDAIETQEGKAGEVYRLGPEAFGTARHLSSVHDMDFATALDFGRKAGMTLPRQIVIFAIEAQDTRTFSEECTLEVSRAIPVCVDMVLNEINELRDQ